MKKEFFKLRFCGFHRKRFDDFVGAEPTTIPKKGSFRVIESLEHKCREMSTKWKIMNMILKHE